MRKNVGLLMVALVLACSAAPILAHHSVSGEYDPNKKVSIKGTVSKIEWTNPHARIYVDVNEGGKVTTWNFELAARSALTRQGWTGTSVKVGDTVTVEADAARSGIPGGHTTAVILKNGSRVFTGENDN